MGEWTGLLHARNKFQQVSSLLDWSKFSEGANVYLVFSSLPSVLINCSVSANEEQHLHSSHLRHVIVRRVCSTDDQCRVSTTHRDVPRCQIKSAKLHLHSNTLLGWCALCSWSTKNNCINDNRCKRGRGVAFQRGFYVFYWFLLWTVCSESRVATSKKLNLRPQDWRCCKGTILHFIEANVLNGHHFILHI